MALDMDDQLRLERILEAAEETPSRLSEWEIGFVADQQTRYEEGGAEIVMTPAQWGILKRIERKLGV